MTNMNIQDFSDDELRKTFCHLKNNVLENNQKNWNEFPLAYDDINKINPWERIEKEVTGAMAAIEKELEKRNLPIPQCYVE